MDRRKFIVRACTLPLVSYASTILATDRSDTLDSTSRESEGFQSFAYYQGLGPSDTRDPGRTDGTTYQMPCISPEDVALGTDKQYEYWHGHGGRNHQFTVTASDFARLQQGEKVELLTSVVEGHRHALLISPEMPCESLCR